MDFSFSIIVFLLHFVILFLFFSPVYSSRTGIHQLANRIGSVEEVHKLKKTMRNDLQSINKSALKTIQSPDGDIIDCVVFDKQLAFDHSLLKEQKSLDPPEIPRDNKNALSDNFQLWSLSGESCPEETIAIRRTEEKAIFNGYADHEHSYGSLAGDIYHGAKATISVWAPHVESPNEFSLAQMWIVGTNGIDDNNKNTVEAGWHVC
ncbi:putative neprosin [Medicago truncatula]|uniref:Putative neprosin n=1 Tax=Medicago truncatula TaxID=3880 RepID=A0A396GSK8_MEDTR|nr:putative neprosin [Medicago truncatula]